MASPSFLSPNPYSGNGSSSDYNSDCMSDMYELTPTFNDDNSNMTMATSSLTSLNKRKSSKKTVSTFIQKLYDMLENNTYANLMSWCPSGTSFSIVNAKTFAAQVLPAHFKHSNFSSFVRLLNMYGFHKISKSPRGQRSSDKEIWEFSHTKFIRGRSDLLKDIKRKSMDSETLRRETGDIQASFAMLQMSQSDLLQQFYTLQESFSTLFNGLEESRKIQQQQQVQIRQLIERQQRLDNDNSMKWEPTDTLAVEKSNNQTNTRTLHHRRSVSTPSLPPNQQFQNQYQPMDEPFKMLVTTPSSSTNPTPNVMDKSTPGYWINNNNNNSNSNSLRSVSQPPPECRTSNNDMEPVYSPLSFQTAVNTPLPPSPMMVVSPDMTTISPGSSEEDSLGSYAFNLGHSSNTLDLSFI